MSHATSFHATLVNAGCILVGTFTNQVEKEALWKAINPAKTLAPVLTFQSFEELKKFVPVWQKENDSYLDYDEDISPGNNLVIYTKRELTMIINLDMSWEVYVPYHSITKINGETDGHCYCWYQVLRKFNLVFQVEEAEKLAWKYFMYKRQREFSVGRDSEFVANHLGLKRAVYVSRSNGPRDGGLYAILPLPQGNSPGTQSLLVYWAEGKITILLGGSQYSDFPKASVLYFGNVKVGLEILSVAREMNLSVLQNMQAIQTTDSALADKFVKDCIKFLPKDFS